MREGNKMFHYSNLFQVYIQADGLVRIDFKVADPTGKEQPAMTAGIYLKADDASALAKLLAELLERPLKPGEGVRMN